MKMKILNYVSAGCFLASSVSLLFIPFINIEEALPQSAYILSGVFWVGLIAGIILQALLIKNAKTLEKTKKLKKTRLVIAIVFGASVLSGILVLSLLSTNAYAVSINLFAILMSAETYCVIKRMEGFK